MSRFVFLVIISACTIFMNLPAYSEDDKDNAADKVIARILLRSGPEFEHGIKYIESKHPLDIALALGEMLIQSGDMQDKQGILSALKIYPVNSIKDIYIRVLEKTTSFAVKKEIITIMGKAGDRSFVIPISRELENPFFAVREAAVLALREIGDDRMFPAIFKMAENSNPIYKVYALEAIYYLYDIRLLPIVQNLVNDENKSVRILALLCVEKNNIDRVIPSVRTIALGDQNNEVRVAAINTLGKIGDSGAMSVMFKTISSDNRAIRFATVQNLPRFRFRQTPYYVSEQIAVESDNQIKSMLIDILIDMKDGGGFKGLEMLIDREKYIPLKIKGVYALGVIGGQRASAILQRAVKDSEYKVRAEACNSIVFSRDKSTVQLLVSVVNNDSERYVRLAALYSIERMKDRSAVIPLYDRYSVEKDPVFKMKLFEITRLLIQSSI